MFFINKQILVVMGYHSTAVSDFINVLYSTYQMLRPHNIKTDQLPVLRYYPVIWYWKKDECCYYNV